MTSTKWLILSLTLLIWPSIGYARNRTYHNQGLLARVYLGTGSGSFSSDLYNKTTWDGGYQFSVNAQIGGFLHPSFAVHGGFSFIRALATDVKTSPEIESLNPEGNYTVKMLSVGISYYILPQNLYISPELRLSGTAKTELTFPKAKGKEQTYQSSRGFAITLGKEWQFQSQLGLGLALAYYQDLLAQDQNTIDFSNDATDVEAMHYHFSILFSAIYTY